MRSAKALPKASEPLAGEPASVMMWQFACTLWDFADAEEVKLLPSTFMSALAI
jgi:hypothetical protein